MITGAAGQVGREFGWLLDRHAASVDSVFFPASELDVTNQDAVFAAVESVRPDVIINAAAMTAVDRCEVEIDRAYAVNALGVRHLVQAASLFGGQVVHYSTDYVFDGESSTPYCEWDLANPESVYGRSKYAGERELRPSDLCVRTAWLVGRFGGNMAKTVLRLSSAHETLRFVNDQIGSPTIAEDLVAKSFELIMSRASGMFHITNAGTATWFDFARAVLEFSGQDPERVLPISSSDLPGERRAPRPSNSVLDNMALRLEGFAPMPEWRASLESLVVYLTKDEVE
jgi:dTDP-4-dehydrorhamnose reductase